MDIVYDDIIYSLQKGGGVSVYWTEVVKPTVGKAVHYVYDNAADNIFYRKLTFQNKKELSSKFMLIKRFMNPKYGRKKTFIFHSSYFRYCRDEQAINITTVHDFIAEKYGYGIRSIGHRLQKNPQ